MHLSESDVLIFGVFVFLFSSISLYGSKYTKVTCNKNSLSHWKSALAYQTPPVKPGHPAAAEESLKEKESILWNLEKNKENNQLEL